MPESETREEKSQFEGNPREWLQLVKTVQAMACPPKGSRNRSLSCMRKCRLSQVGIEDLRGIGSFSACASVALFPGPSGFVGVRVIFLRDFNLCRWTAIAAGLN